MANSNRQQIVCDYIQENLVQFGRLRHDLISNKVQIAVTGDGLPVTGWRDITQLNKDERLRRGHS